MQRLIDADAVVSGVKNRRIGQNDVIKFEHSIISMLHMMQTIDAEPVRHGKWIKCDEDKWEHIYALRCSKCNGGYHLSHETTTAWNYCPNCGARMDEE